MLHNLQKKLLRSVSVICAFGILLFGPGKVQGQFTQGNLSVLQVGTSSGSLNSAATQLSVVEYNLAGVVTYSLSLPGTGAGAITNSGVAVSEGQITLSAERDRLMIAGYNAPVGTGGIASTVATTYPRALMAVTSSGTYSIVGTTSTLYSANNIRSGTASGTTYYSAGASSGTIQGGTAYLNTSTTLTTGTGINSRVVQIYNGQLYFSSASASSVGINTLGAGLPTTCCQATTLIAGSPATNSYGFSISPDGNTLYVADQTAGILKFTKSGATYTYAYNVNSAGSGGIAVDYSGTQNVIYATTSTGVPNNLIKITDAGPASAFSFIAAAPTSTVYRSVQFSPYCGATVSVLGASTVCSGSTAQLVFKGNPTGVVAYNINGTPYTTTIGANGYDTVTTPAITTNSTVNLVNITTQACAATPITGTVSVNIFPVATIASIATDGPVCAASNLHLSAGITASAGPYNYVWTGPSGYLSSTGASVVLTNSATVTSITTLPVNPVYSLAVTDGNGCSIHATVTTTVNPQPNAYPVFGSGSYCAGGTGVDVQLSNSEIGVNYQLYNTTGTVGAPMPGTGSVVDFGHQPAGVYTVSAMNTTTGCTNSMMGAGSISVNPLPAVITGTMTVCTTLTTTLSDASAPGVWSSGTPSVASIGSGTGIVTGATAGTTIITYTLPTTCSITTIVTVNPLPLPVSGSNTVCMGLSITLSDLTGGGNWSSGNTGVATISGGGVITTVSSGTTNISYTLPTGCMANSIVTVNPLPLAITGTTNVCVASTISLSDASGGGTWSSSNATIGTVGATSGLVTGVAQGTIQITYTLPTTCMIATPITVNPLPATISGALNACVGFSSALSDVTPAGNWTSGNTVVATIGSGTGLVSGLVAGTSNISYTLSATGCAAASIFTVNPLPVTISGPAAVCAGSLATYSDASGGGTWTSSNTGVATIGSSSGILSAVMAGTTRITYTIGTGCNISTVITINPLPAAITGTNSVCAGLVTSLSDVTTGGTWSSSAGSLASVDGSGNVTGSSAGPLYISYTLPTGCFTTTTFTVNPLPGVINGPSSICAGSSVTLTDASAGGTWTSSAPGFVSIVSGTGFTSGVMGGTSIITYTLPTGCLITKGMTVNILPAAITGNSGICVGASMTLSDLSAGGTWSSSNTAYAIVGSSTGVVTGTGAGMPVITYTLPTTCFTTAIVTVNPIPAAVSGNLEICVGATTGLSDVPAGGTWNIGSAGTASVVATTGIVTGIAAGTAAITYTSPAGCMNTAIVTVNPLPPGITGTLNVCSGGTTVLSDVVTGGTWSSMNPSVAGVGPTGIVNGLGAGVAVISYLPPTGCGTYVSVTVNPLPVAISGNTSVCIGLTSVLSDASGGGTWSSSTPAVASIGSSSGIINGLALGTSIITYMLPTGCIITTQVTVNPLPAVISGNESVCAGATTNLSDPTSGGTWSSSAPGTAAIAAIAGVVSGVSAGTATITYMLGTGCFSTAVVTVNPLPATISGITQVCLGFTTSLSDISAGGTWSSSSSATASIGSSSGVVSGNASGTASITYTLVTGCLTATTVTVNPLPSAILGSTQVCIGSAITLSDAGGGTWFTESTTIISITSTGGLVGGLAVGTALVSYTLPTGCITTTLVTVNPLPAAIAGSTGVCAGLSATLSDVTAGGVWSSGNPAIATIGSGSGVINGISGGSVTITYTISATGCFTTTVVTVTPLPPGITGIASICQGQTTAVSNIVSGGIWSSGSPSIASIGSTGIVTGLAAGTSNITYTVASGCVSIRVVTVNPLPSAISGATTLCVGLTTTLSDLLTGGTWQSSNTSVAIVSSGSGIVTAIATGSANITYTLPTGCTATVVTTVNPLPNAILGMQPLCAGSSITVADLATGGSWSIAPSGVASVTPVSGDITGIAAGTAIVTYTLPTGCYVTSILTVNPLPLSITGTTNTCVGGTATLTDASPGGTWSSSNTSFATIGLTTGIVNGISQGTPLITYKLPTGCITTIAFIVNPLPASISGNRSVCIGSTSTLSDASGGGTWSISGSATVGSVSAVSGVVSGLSLGTAIVTYTLPTGCSIATTITVNPFPTSIIGDTLKLCQGYNLALTDTTATGTWSSANTTIATVTGIGVVTGLSAGTVNISYTLSTGCGVAAVVTVNPLFPVTGSNNICAGNTTTLTDLATGGSWSSSNTAVATIGSSTGNITGVASGAAIITYYLNTGCIAYTPVTINPVPSLYVVTGGGSYCMGSAGVSIGLNGSDTGTVYNLLHPASVAAHTGTDSAFSFGTFLSPGGYTVLATDITTGCTSTMTGSATIIANPVVVPSVAISALSGSVICNGSSAGFSAIPAFGGTAPLYQWSVNGTNVATSATYSYTPANGDHLSVKLTSNAVCAIPDTAVATIVITTSAGITPSVSIAASPGDTVCAGTPVTLTALPVFGGLAPTYRWMKNGIYVDTGATYTFVPIDGDNIFCDMHADISCALADPVHSNNITMRVPSVSVAMFTISAYPGVRIVAGETDTLVALVTASGGQALFYQWEVNSVAVPGATTDTFISNTLHNLDIVTCVVTGTSICGSGTRSSQVQIIDTSVTLGLQNVHSGTGDIRLVPNPNTGEFKVKGVSAGDEDVNIVISDMLGQVIYKKSFMPKNGMIDEPIKLNATLANGMYLLELRSGSVNKAIHFVVER